MLPKFDMIPELCDAAKPSALIVCGTSSPLSRAQAAAAPRTPNSPVGCHPFLLVGLSQHKLGPCFKSNDIGRYQVTAGSLQNFGFSQKRR